jgi:hypothetical protein
VRQIRRDKAHGFDVISGYPAPLRRCRRSNGCDQPVGVSVVDDKQSLALGDAQLVVANRLIVVERNDNSDGRRHGEKTKTRFFEQSSSCC